MKYQLNVLNDSDLEVLAQDLLTRHLKLKFHIYKKGRDKGIDLRYSGTRGNKVIVQVKHFINSKVSDLIHHLIYVEKPKLKKLSPRPQRYIVFTSLSLSVGNVDQILKGMKPFIISADDIYGGDQIQSLLSQHADIERKHFKLWLTSATVLRKIFDNAVTGKSEFYEEKIVRNIKLYVPTENYAAAIRKLNKNKFIIISGAPGIGKTTISYLLIYGLLAKGYKLVYIEDKIRDGEMQLEGKASNKQIFYFDDFLGSNITDILNSKNSQNSIVNFIERIQHAKNKLLILTTRTTLLKKAEQTYEKLANSKFGTIAKYEVELAQYSMLSRAKILYNHIFHSNVPKEYLNGFFENRNYLNIIIHPNYAPRLIEFFTDFKNLDKTTPEKFWEFVVQNLNNPSQIWANAYINQLHNDDRFLLMTLFSLGGSKVDYGILQTAYDIRLEYQLKTHAHPKQINSFRMAMNHLLDGFITSSQHLENEKQTFSFINPSVADFLLNQLRDSRDERHSLLYSAYYFEQVSRNFHSHDRFNHIRLEGKELEAFHDHYIQNAANYAFSNEDISITERAVSVLRYYIFVFDDYNTQFTLAWMNKLIPSEFRYCDISDLSSILQQLSVIDEVTDYLDERADEILKGLIEGCTNADDFNEVSYLCKHYFDWNLHIHFNNRTSACQALNKIFSEIIADDDDLAGSDAPEIFEYFYNGAPEAARDRIESCVEKKYSRFLEDAGLTEFKSSLGSQLSLNYHELLKKVIDDFNVSHEPVTNSLKDTKKPVPEKDNELEQIVALFSRWNDSK